MAQILRATGSHAPVDLRFFILLPLPFRGSKMKKRWRRAVPDVSPGAGFAAPSAATSATRVVGLPRLIQFGVNLSLCFRKSPFYELTWLVARRLESTSIDLLCVDQVEMVEPRPARRAAGRRADAKDDGNAA